MVLRIPFVISAINGLKLAKNESDKNNGSWEKASGRNHQCPSAWLSPNCQIIDSKETRCYYMQHNWHFLKVWYDCQWLNPWPPTLETRTLPQHHRGGWDTRKLVYVMASVIHKKNKNKYNLSLRLRRTHHNNPQTPFWLPTFQKLWLKTLDYTNLLKTSP